MVEEEWAQTPEKGQAEEHPEELSEKLNQEPQKEGSDHFCLMGS